METYIAHNFQEALQWEQEHLQNKAEGLCVLFHDKTMVQLGRNGTANTKIAEKFNIPVWRASHNNGSIVCFEGDLTFYLLSDIKSRIHYKLYNIIKQYLLSLDVGITFSNNDGLIDDKKIFAAAHHRKDEMMQSLYHFSINTYLPLIQDICTKEMIKIPGSLSKYGLDAETIWNGIKDQID